MFGQKDREARAAPSEAARGSNPTPPAVGHDETNADIDDLRRIAGGDVRALRRLYDRHARAVYAFALRRLEDAADAEEVVGDTFYAVWQRAAAFGGRSAARTWILGIARHKVLDVLRRRGEAVAEPLDEPLIESLPDPADAPLDRLCARADAAALDRALRALPPEQREALYLFAYEGLSLAEIGAIQNAPVATVGSRLHLARRTLRKLLGDGNASA